MTYNWITILLIAIIVGSMLYGAARGFGRESHLVIWQLVSIATGLCALGVSWFLSQRISTFVLHQKTTNLPHIIEQIFVAWQRSPRIAVWIAFFICYLILSSLFHRIIGLFIGGFPVRLPRPLFESRLLGGALGAAMGVVRSAVVGAIVFLALQYVSLPALAKQAAASTPYQTLSHRIYEPWLKPFVARELPVLAQGALQPLSRNIDLFAVPSGPDGQDSGVLIVPKQIADLSHQITHGISDPKAKAKALYEWEIHHVKYDWKKYDDYVYHGKWDQQSPLQTLQTGKGVCADYALLYADLAHASGLSVKIDEGIGGTAQNNGSHAWNEVYIPNENQWIMVDTTWGSEQDAWFDVPRTQFNETHALQTSIVINASAK
ncbi:transglutaminase domain-containing protein [Alicyclobacillus dauci]|uniref:Transglutaminase domain-containing protein n=1 Tax=Alicyclobacillus dauci TaxID=1475485 RepID=A0ABY6Z881_9BACL|nr:transglutaminase domain-containing protein [Alicyclobacillus dauci]WAH39091.1 transglutaminase domain-containing protein [Alicyclobacillus dauci]